jgi:DNA processing protein
MVRGVDTASHRGAIAARGKTIAVFGTGVDVIYAKENSHLAEQILALGGALGFGVSAGDVCGPAELSDRQPYPERNASGRAGCGSSGVFENPASPQAARSRKTVTFSPYPERLRTGIPLGPKSLMKQGARLVATWDDVWEDLPPDDKLALAPASSPESGGAGSASLFPDEGFHRTNKRILSLLKSNEATHIVEMVERRETELCFSEIFAARLELELTGQIGPLPGKNFIKSF